MGTRLIKSRKNGCSAKAQEALTDQMKVFLLELQGDLNFNGTEAARKAGYKHPSVAATRLLKNPKIRAALGKALRERTERCELKADLILQEVAYCAMRDPLDLCDEEGRISINDLREVPERIRRCIDGFKIKRRVDAETGDIEDTIELKLAPKLGSLELAMKHMGLMAADKKEVNVTNINWDILCEPSGNGHDPIEQQIIDVGK